LGATIHRHQVEPGRTNVLALFGEPRVVLTTHLDTVAPFVPPTLLADRVTGRGSCDAKGQVVAQLAAIEALLAEGFDRVAFLGVVGEETDALGAAAAEHWRKELRTCRLLVGGEPTNLALATGQRGYQHLRLTTTGLAAHSGSPEKGRNAIWPLVDWLGAVRANPRPQHPDLGPEVWNLGLIEGGSAANVVPDHAVAEVLCRTVPDSTFLDEVRRSAPDAARVDVLVDESPEHYPRLEGFEYEAMPFGSDVPTLRKLVPGARVALAGCGRIEVAHTQGEHLTAAELLGGVALNRELCLLEAR
ncbi:MAG: M20/M25/M40 family metallo-hydrolase, partial [Planctomycetota bacterium]